MFVETSTRSLEGPHVVFLTGSAYFVPSLQFQLPLPGTMEQRLNLILILVKMDAFIIIVYLFGLEFLCL